VGGGTVFLPFGRACSFVTFFGSRKRSTHRVLHKEQKKVKGSKVVVGDGRRDHRRPVARLCAPKGPLVAAKSVGEHLHDHKKTRCQGFRGKFRGVRGSIQSS
jgi:hypothetical protein